jgi:hypothetical protein
LEGTFGALMRGHPEHHDEWVTSAPKVLSQEVDMILPAQASMAWLETQLSYEDKKGLILTSPELSVQYLVVFL